MKNQRFGGRQKGTPNKTTALAKEMMTKWLEAHSTIPKGETIPLIMQDFMALDPRDRVKVSVEFIKALTPKNINVDNSETHLTIEDKLIALAGENNGEE